MNRVRRHPPFFKRHRQRLRENQPAIQTQIAIASDGLPSRLRQINCAQRWKPTRQTRPIQIRGQPIVFLRGRRAFFGRHAPDQFVIQRKFVLTPAEYDPIANADETNQIGWKMFFQLPAVRVFFHGHPRPRFENISQIGLPKLRAAGIQPDRQRKFRRPVRRVADLQEPFRAQQIVEQRPKLPGFVVGAGRYFLFEPVVRRAGKFVQRLLAERLRLGRTPKICERNGIGVGGNLFGAREMNSRNQVRHRWRRLSRNRSHHRRTKQKS